jgi:hypothetical protein
VSRRLEHLVSSAGYEALQNMTPLEGKLTWRVSTTLLAGGRRLTHTLCSFMYAAQCIWRQHHLTIDISLYQQHVFIHCFMYFLIAGSVTWSTWGSKLESIFTPIFATLPTLQGIQVYTHINSPLDIYLAQGLSKENASKWRDTMVYVIMGEQATSCCNIALFSVHTTITMFMFNHNIVVV